MVISNFVGFRLDRLHSNETVVLATFFLSNIYDCFGQFICVQIRGRLVFFPSAKCSGHLEKFIPNLSVLDSFILRIHLFS